MYWIKDYLKKKQMEKVVETIYENARAFEKPKSSDIKTITVEEAQKLGTPVRLNVNKITDKLRAIDERGDIKEI